MTVLSLLVRKLGGGRWAMALAAAATTCSVGLFLFHFYSLNAIDLLMWPTSLLLLTRALEAPTTRNWLVVGLVLGLALLNKLSAIWLGGAMLLAVLATPYRRLLTRRGPWLAGMLALGIFAPHLVWQQTHGWPTLEFVANARHLKIEPLSPAGFWASQLQMIGPVSLLVTAAGILFAVFRRRATPLAVTGLTCLVVAVYLTLDPYAKPYYLLTAMLGGFAVGGIAVENFVRARGRMLRHGLPAVVVLLQIGFGVIMAPAATPILSQEGTVRYLQRLGLAPSSGERAPAGLLPQHLADLNGWEGLARDVAEVFHGLPAAEQAHTAIYGTNYGRAGAIDVFGPALGLPPALSVHNSYWFWGRKHLDADTYILVGGERDDYAGLFEDLELARVHTDPWARPGDARTSIFIGRGPLKPLAEIWPDAKEFI